MSDSDGADPSSERGDEQDVIREVGVGFAAGVAAWLLGYAITYVVAAARVRESLASAEIGPIEWDLTTEVVGWLFYGAHFVDAQVPTPGPLGPTSVDLLAEAGGSALLLYVVPVACLFAAGYGAASMARGLEDPTDYARAGAMTATGYLPLSAIGIAFFALSVGDGFVRPEPATALLLAGLAYPVLLGTLGGVARSYA